jgi:hypothetical protein
LKETFKLVGNYMSSTWTPSDDHHGGVNLVDPPAPTSQALDGVMAHDPGGQAVSGVTANDPGSQTLGGVMANDPGPLRGGSPSASPPNQDSSKGATDNFTFNFGALDHHTAADLHSSSDSLLFASPFVGGTPAAVTATLDDGHATAGVPLDGQDAITLGGLLKVQLHFGDFHVV